MLLKAYCFRFFFKDILNIEDLAQREIKKNIRIPFIYLFVLYKQIMSSLR